VKGRGLRQRLAVPPGTSGPVLSGIDSRSTPEIDKRGKAERELVEGQERLRELQDRLYAAGSRAVLVILQGLDTSGKDGTIKHVMGAVNPQSCRVVSFKAPTPDELRHHFLWRIRRVLPRPGELGIFNRSHYEDILVPKARGLLPAEVLERRHDEINRFERKLVDGGTLVLKFCLHISPEEQRERLLARLDDPSKRWKFREADLEDRGRWAEFQAAYDSILARCSMEWAPWYVIPADRKWYRNWAVAGVLIEALEELDPRYPEPRLDLERLRRRLAKEGISPPGRVSPLRRTRAASGRSSRPSR
jgi:PPK2 family polyphosphate:nucleotide phosphotransferase